MIHSLRAVFIILLLAMQVLLGATADAGTKVHTPPPGSAERRMLLELMRRKVMELSRLDVVFVVKEMNDLLLYTKCTAKQIKCRGAP